VEGNVTDIFARKSTFTKLSIENLVPERIRRDLLYRNQTLAFVEPGFVEAGIDSRMSIPLSCTSMVEAHC